MVQANSYAAIPGQRKTLAHLGPGESSFKTPCGVLGLVRGLGHLLTRDDYLRDWLAPIFRSPDKEIGQMSPT